MNSAFRARLPSSVEFYDLLNAGRHPLVARRERTALIVDRVQKIAAIFALLTLAWIGVDAVSVSWPSWGELALGRIAASLAFAWLAIHRFILASTRVAYHALGALIAVPLSFYLLAKIVLNEDIAGEGSLGVIAAYYYLPFIVAAGLSIFPLTALEAALFASPVLCVMAASIAIWPDLLAPQSALATVWRLVISAGISALAGMSQLRLLLVLTEQGTRDGLTGLLVRRVGEEILQQQFSVAARRNMPLSILFLDLDNFKRINDDFGHVAGDEVLRTVAAKLRQALRRQDILVRWGGEEFLIVLPDSDAASAEATVLRLAALGIGPRPDGGPVTASIGIAERMIDAVGEAQLMVTLADERMYAAKAGGRNRYCFHNGPRLWYQPATETHP